MNIRETLDREFDGSLPIEKKRKKAAERQQTRRDKLKAEGKVRFSADIDSISNERFKWILDIKGNITKAELIERLIQREFNANSRALYEKRNKALNEFGYNNLSQNSELSQKLLDDLNRLNVKKTKKSDRKYKQSIHPTAQPINRSKKSKKSKNEIDDYQGTNEAFDDFTF